MSRNFKALTITQQNTPLWIRELVALNAAESNSLLRRFKEYTDANDVLVLSTCNRTEIYFSSEETTLKDALRFLSLEKHINQLETVEEYTNFIEEKDAAIRHLFRVATGLESSITGDMQISNQVKRAYQLSADMDLAGPFLHRLMHTVFFTNKRVIQETPFRDGSASIAYLAANLATDLGNKILDPRILVFGTGKIGSNVCRNLKESNIQNVTLINRTEEKAISIARECGFTHLHISHLKHAIQEADVVISSVSAERPLITRDLLDETKISHKLFIDLSVPRSVESNIDQIAGVLVHNIDEIKSKASEALTRRMNSIPQVESILEDTITDFNKWNKEMLVSPTINKLKSALEEIRMNEMARYLKDISDEEAELMDKVTRNIMQKIIKLPALELKAACKRGEAETLIDVLNDLFDLEKQKNSSIKS